MYNTCSLVRFKCSFSILFIVLSLFQCRGQSYTRSNRNSIQFFGGKCAISKRLKDGRHFDGVMTFRHHFYNFVKFERHFYDLMTFGFHFEDVMKYKHHFDDVMTYGSHFDDVIRQKSIKQK